MWYSGVLCAYTLIGHLSVGVSSRDFLCSGGLTGIQVMSGHLV